MSKGCADVEVGEDVVFEGVDDGGFAEGGEFVGYCGCEGEVDGVDELLCVS
jgi:hypothetical protein